MSSIKPAKALQKIGVIDGNHPPCSLSAGHIIRSACNSLSKQVRFTVFTTPLKLICADLDSTYNVALPMWREARLAGAKLFDVQLPSLMR